MEIQPIARIRSCFGGKFATPRQPGLCPDAWGELHFEPDYRSPEAVRGIEGFSHLWLVFGFHLTADAGWHPTVRPPRLGGNERVGVFASRSTFRPNGLGLSLVRLESVKTHGPSGPVLFLGGIDLADQTPIYDIKPYLPYAEALPEALAGFAPEAPRLLDFSAEPASGFHSLPPRSQRVIEQALRLDPRPPAGRDEPGRVYGAALCGHEVKFRVSGNLCQVIHCERSSTAGLEAESSA